jgi:predicted dehydrogenase
MVPMKRRATAAAARTGACLMSAFRIPRRDFLRSSVAAAGSVAAASTARAADRLFGANDRINVAIIGLGARGHAMIRELERLGPAANTDLVTVCDVWRLRRDAAVEAAAQRLGKRPIATDDYRRILDDPRVDAVFIDTPDVWHIPILTEALKADKDAYVEKPMATDLDAAHEAARLTRQRSRIVQVGTQRRSDPKYDVAAEFLRDGRLGNVTMVECAWNDNKPRWRVDRRALDAVNQEDTNWDAYTRVLPLTADRSFNPKHLLEWQLFFDFTTGTVGLLGSHMIDVVHWVLDAHHPKSCVASGGVLLYADDGRQVEDTLVAVYEYPQDFLLQYTTRFGNSRNAGAPNPGIIVHGTRGTFYVDQLHATGEGGGADRILEDIQLTPPPPESHVRNFLDCVRSRKDPNGPIERGIEHSIPAIMARTSQRTGRKTVYDPDSRRIDTA